MLTSSTASGGDFQLLLTAAGTVVAAGVSACVQRAMQCGSLVRWFVWFVCAEVKPGSRSRLCWAGQVTGVPLNRSLCRE